MPDETVSARYQQVLAWREDGLTYTAIGQRLRVSPSRARRLWRQAVQWRQRERGVSPASSTVTPVTAEMPLEVLPITVRGKIGLRRAGLQTVGEVAALSDVALLRMRGIGPGTLATLRAYLAQHDVSTREGGDGVG